MSEPLDNPLGTAATPESDPAREKRRKKKKDKARSAWISFFGRIVAQVLGAAATIGLGLFVVHNFKTRENESPVGTPQRDLSPARVNAPRDPGVVALAVLPLDNFSSDPQEDYFADGMTEALIADLAPIEGLRVISRTSSMQYKDRHKSLPEIGAELGVDLIVEGSVVRAGERVRVTAQLIDAKSDEHIWARSYNRTVRDVLALQGQVASAIAGELKRTLTASQQDRLTQRRPVDPAVYDLYLRGRHAWNLRSESGFQNALRYFEQAIEKDPSFAPAYAGVADALSLMSSPPQSESDRERIAKAKAAAERALKLDEGLAEAHTSLAALNHRNEGNLQAAEREFRRAIELNPGYATAHQWYAIFLAEESRDEEATLHAQQAVTLDPLSAALHQTLGLAHYYGRRYEQAVSAERRALELAPHLPLAREILGRSLIARGTPKEAIQVFEQVGAPTNADTLGVLGLAYLRAGDRARADSILKQLLGRRPVPTNALARWYAATENHTAALEMLERILDGGSSLQSLKGDPIFDGLRADERFAALLPRAGQR